MRYLLTMLFLVGCNSNLQSINVTMTKDCQIVNPHKYLKGLQSYILHTNEGRFSLATVGFNNDREAVCIAVQAGNTYEITYDIRNFTVVAINRPTITAEKQ